MALVAALLSPPALSAPAATTTRYAVDTLRSEFILETKQPGKFRYIVVNAFRRTNMETEEVKLAAVAGKGTCSLGGGADAACGIDLLRYRVVRFTADDAFTTARVVLKRGKVRHDLTWTMTTPFSHGPVGQEPNLCGGETTKVYLMAKNARAEGRVFGRNLSTSDEADDWRESEKMIQTIDIQECA